jgi:hypothetical protein
MIAADIEIAVVNYFKPRANIVVPNVSWAFSHYEMDLLVITQSNYAYEIEIKTSKADLINDKKKKHTHDCDKIKYLFFAIPESLIQYKEHIPEDAGIFICTENYYGGGVRDTRLYRKPKKRYQYELSLGERYGIARLGYLRMWDLKKKVNRVKAALK